MLWGGKLAGIALGIRERVCVTTPEVNEFDIVVNSGKQDIIRLQVKMKHLMAVQIAECIQQLTDELVCMFPIPKIVGICSKPMGKGLAIDILHQNAIMVEREVAHQVWMLQTIARLKLLAKSLLVSDVASIFGFQPLQEMQFAIKLHTESVTGSSP